MLTNITWLDLCLASAGVYLVKQAFSKKNLAPYPPGPAGWPLIGNISDIPHIKVWLTFAEWGKKYGDISHVEVLGQHIIVLNSIKTAMELLDKKSPVYSDRPVRPMGGELVGWKHSLGLLSYGDRFRCYRKNVHRIIGNRTAISVYNTIEEIETYRFLKRVFAKPEQLQAHIRHTAGAIILRISYGYEVKENNDPFVDLADRAMDQLSRCTATGAFMVDLMPWCKTTAFRHLQLPDYFQWLIFPSGFLVLNSSAWPVNGTRPWKRWLMHHTNSSRIKWLPELLHCLSLRICWKAVLCLPKRITR